MSIYCVYGCGLLAEHQNKSGKFTCRRYSSQCEVNRKKNSSGGKKSYQDQSRKKTEWYDSLPQETKDRMAWSRGKINDNAFTYGGTGNHKKYLIGERGHRCESCKLSIWLNKSITLELDHIDGDIKNNVKDNLKLLCPNCHSVTPTWKGRNKDSVKRQRIVKNGKSGWFYVSDEELLIAIKNNKNIRQALMSVGLTPKGGNYERAYNLKNGACGEMADTADLIKN